MNAPDPLVATTVLAPVPVQGQAGSPAERLALRAALGRYATGVAIITCRDAEGEAVGLTANSFSALSLEPPLVLWSLRRASSVLGVFAGAAGFAVNVLTEEQVGLSRRFASREADKFAEGTWRDGLGGAPLLDGCAAHFECALLSQQVAGDHVLFIGEVLRHAHDADAPPLVFHAGHYHGPGDRL